MRPFTLIGMGRVGSHLLQIFHEKGIPVRQVLARKTEQRIKITDAFRIPLIEKWEDLKLHDGCYLLAVPDDQIETAANRLTTVLKERVFIAHTSGTTPTSVLKMHSETCGIFYPLQSFSLEAPVSWQGLPIFIDANDHGDLEFLRSTGETIGANVIHIEEHQRPYLHLSAVIAHNFSNALFSWSEEILHSNGLSFSYLHPLILDGLKKSMDIGPKAAQTGPAQRGDRHTIEKHIELLADQPDKRELYILLSRLINPEIDDPS